MCYRDDQIFDHIIKIKKTYGLVQYIQRLLNMLYYLFVQQFSSILENHFHSPLCTLL